MSFGNFMYSKIPWIQLFFVVVKVSCHCGMISVFDVKNMTLESINVSVFCLTYIFNMPPVAFQTVYMVIALVSAIS